MLSHDQLGKLLRVIHHGLPAGSENLRTDTRSRLSPAELRLSGSVYSARRVSGVPGCNRLDDSARGRIDHLDAVAI